MTSTGSLDRLMHDLKVIASLREGDRVYIADGLLHVLHPSLTASLWRFARGDSREKSIAAVSACLTDALHLADHKVERLSTLAGPTQDSARRHARHLLQEIECACSGLRQMRATYVADASTIATLDVTREKVAGKILTLRARLGEECGLSPAYQSFGRSNLLRYALEDDWDGDEEPPS